MSLVNVEHLSKTYLLDSVRVTGLADVSATLEAGRFTVLSGPSGSGKTTLLNMIGCIDRPDSGRVTIAGHDTASLSDDALSDFRARHVGHVFQTFNLLPVLSAYENVEYPLLMAGWAPARRAARVRDLLDAVGLADKGRHRPSQLSGGQRQRVAIARALAAEPAMVLADEPTANLDSATGHAIIALMRTIQRERDVSFIVSSHDPQVVSVADEVIRILDGRIVGRERAGDGTAAQEVCR
ncbi:MULTISPECIES: ABC transporter ATP-binding protein [Burkholderia]|uniref:ABC transporter ATP-binding protein n=2 Tax=Burkholderia cepacia complex TaxID=87882 RepID=A0A8A8DFL6_9BURK|nr:MULTISPECIES: ABC transporter ATP-binding protein [Burkholderia]AOJ26547.1 ABC transporter [Burkholderia seminalis]MBN3743714.1 ABC transporter ATP-binding protein [Burkholderia sp. Tr-20355]MCA8038566.1 ABC transporter ATP-binding protein [Burkholderia seminalis]MCA8305380.1 ABC transporter ATP-binding protein [Burkholderia seminalis]MCA8426213.1 ABC transporter ATP-binding protein [Burkholderia seminalis]